MWRARDACPRPAIPWINPITIEVFAMKRILLFLGLAAAAFAAAFATTRRFHPTPKAPAGMVWIPGGEFVMGSAHAKAQRNEQPAHPVKLDGYWMDEHEVTNAEFRQFVEATGYVTTAEKPPDWE